MERPEYYGNPAGLTSDVDVVRAIYDAFAERNLEGALEYMAPDVELHVEGTNRLSGRQAPYRGHDGVREYFADVQRVWTELTLHPDDIRVVPGSVIVLGHVSGISGGNPTRRAAVWTWRVRGGLATLLRVADMGEMA